MKNLFSFFVHKLSNIPELKSLKWRIKSVFKLMCKISISYNQSIQIWDIPQSEKSFWQKLFERFVAINKFCLFQKWGFKKRFFANNFFWSRYALTLYWVGKGNRLLRILVPYSTRYHIMLGEILENALFWNFQCVMQFQNEVILQ